MFNNKNFKRLNESDNRPKISNKFKENQQTLEVLFVGYLNKSKNMEISSDYKLPFEKFSEKVYEKAFQKLEKTFVGSKNDNIPMSEHKNDLKLKIKNLKEEIRKKRKKDINHLKSCWNLKTNEKDDEK